MCYFLTRQVEKCIELLLSASRIAEAALFARAYAPSAVPRIVEMWKEQLKAKKKPRLAEAIADPQSFPNLFTDWDWALKAESLLDGKRQLPIPAAQFPMLQHSLDANVIEGLTYVLVDS